MLLFVFHVLISILCPAKKSLLPLQVPGDTVLVAGATGGVGQLVTAKLLDVRPHILRHAREAYNRQLKGRVESYVCVCNATQRKEARKKAKEKGCDHEFLDLLFNLPRGSKTIKEMLNKCAWRVTGF